MNYALEFQPDGSLVRAVHIKRHRDGSRIAPTPCASYDISQTHTGRLGRHVYVRGILV